MSKEFKFPVWMCDPHLQDLQDLKESGAFISDLKERIEEVEMHERELCEWCEQKGARK